MAERKTKAEIIDETVEFYSRDVSRRAVCSGGGCAYMVTSDESGQTITRYCAVGRCLLPEVQDRIEEEDSARDGDAEALIEWWNRVNDAVAHDPHFTARDRVAVPGLFKPEYDGHEAGFWQNLQHLHDLSTHWNGGLTGTGRDFLAFLREKWGTL